MVHRDMKMTERKEPSLAASLCKSAVVKNKIDRLLFAGNNSTAVVFVESPHKQKGRP
jgi:hypothetical protein